MRYLTVPVLIVSVLFACKQKPTESKSPYDELEGLSYTLYSDRSELFVEFKPLVVGQTARFATHLTLLDTSFLPYREGKVTVSLVQGEEMIRQEVSQPSSPGIFRMELKPVKAGLGKLVFNIQSSGFSDRIEIDSIQVFPDLETAIAAKQVSTGGSDISFLKEQAWKIDFANAPARKEPMAGVIRASGEILSAPGDEVILASKSNGLVKFLGNNNIIGYPVVAGQTLFSITGGEIAFENVEAARQSAKVEWGTSKAEFERAAELIKDKLITQSDYQQAKQRYEQAQISLANLERNYGGSKKVSSPIKGFIKNILVEEGQYVASGQPLATLTRNQRLLLRADVSLKNADKIGEVNSAGFKLNSGERFYTTEELNGKLVAVGKATTIQSPFIPVTFQVDSRPGIMPGSLAEIYLKTKSTSMVLVIPKTALIEEQGIFYAYVQVEGESFQKRELILGIDDGEKVQVVSGIMEGERVVTKGAYQIKLSQASGTMPAHGHEH